MNRTRHFSPAIVIPEGWSPDDALTVVSFLQRISDAIWATHGAAMSYRLHQACQRDCRSVIPISYDLPDDSDDDSDDIDMPF